MSTVVQATHRLIPNAKRYIQVAQVSFHTDAKCYRVRGIVKGAQADYDATDQLISITTNKTLDSPAGTFSITLAGDEWWMPDGTPVLKPNDLVAIYMGYMAESDTVTWVDGTTHVAAEDLDTVMIGLIDTPTRTRNGGGTSATPNIQTVITGRDFGKVFIKAMLKFYPQLGTSTEGEQFLLTTTGWVTLMKYFTNDALIKGSPARLLDTMMIHLLKPLVSTTWMVYDDVSYSPSGTPGYKPAAIENMVRYVFAQTNFFTPFTASAQQYEGTLWNFMSKYNIKPFTELFIDTRDKWEIINQGTVAQTVNETVEETSEDVEKIASGDWGTPVMFGEKDNAQVLLTFRNTPFDKTSWDKLRTHTVAYVDVLQESLSYSDNENYNVFWAGSTMSPLGNTKNVITPLMNQDNVTRYGMNPLEISIEGLEIDRSQSDTTAVELEVMSNDLNTKLKAWYENNVAYLSGMLTIRGKGSVKIGQKLNYKDLGKEFYIEGVGQNFQVYGEWQTQVTVTRGGDSTTTASTVTVSPPLATQTDAQVAAKYYTVQDGDTLQSIADTCYDDSTKWSTLWEANKDTLTARDSRNAATPGKWLYAGQTLIIP